MKDLDPNSLMSDAELSLALRQLREEVAAPAGFRDQVLARLEAAGTLAPLPEAQPEERAWWQVPVLRWGMGLSTAAAIALAFSFSSLKPPSEQAAAQAQAATGPQGPLEVAAASSAQARHQTKAKAVVAQRSDKPKAQVAKAGARGPLEATAATSAQARHQTQAVAEAPLLQAEAQAQVAVPALAAEAESFAASTQIQPAPAGGVDTAQPSVSQHASTAAASTAPMPSFASGGSSAPSAGGNASSAGPAGLPTGPEPTPEPLRASSELRNNVMRASQGEKARLLFKISQPGPVRVAIYDRLGARIAVLHEGELSAGDYGANGRFDWDGRDEQGQPAPSGIYELRLSGPDLSARHKLVLVR